MGNLFILYSGTSTDNLMSFILSAEGQPSIIKLLCGVILAYHFKLSK
jgi:hypothetical protein